MDDTNQVALRAERYCACLDSMDIKGFQALWSEKCLCVLIDPDIVCVGIESICGDYARRFCGGVSLESVDVVSIRPGVAVAVARLRTHNETIVQSQLWALEEGEWKLCHAHGSREDTI